MFVWHKLRCWHENLLFDGHTFPHASLFLSCERRDAKYLIQHTTILYMFSSCTCLTHGLHLNSHGEKKLALLFVKSLSDDNVSGISSILIIINVTTSPLFFSSKAKSQRYLRYDWNYVEFRNQDRTVDSSNSLQIFQWNIRGLKRKTDELINSFETGTINPNVLCFSEHNMEEEDSLHLTLPGYTLGSSFCCQSIQKWGVCIFVSTCTSAKLIFQATVKKRIWKFLPLN